MGLSGNAHYFFAVPLPNGVKHLLSNWAERIKALPFDYKEWVHERDFHLTIKFMGALSDNSIEPLCKEIQECVKHTTPFTMSGHGFGTFGAPQSPRVLYAGVKSAPILYELHNQVERVCTHYGVLKETRRYSPHVTLAKKWKCGRFNQAELPPLPKDYAESWGVARIVLYQIYPERRPKYEVRASFQFGSDHFVSK